MKKRIQGSDEHINKEAVEVAIFTEYVVNNKNIVLLGEHALSLLSGIKKSTYIIEVISQNDVDADFALIMRIVRKSISPSIHCDMITRDLPVLQEYRQKRTTIKIEGKEPIYIYNSAHHDIIPFNVIINKEKGGNSIQVANPYVLLRFFIIGFWMIKYVLAIGSIDEKYAAIRLESTIDKIIDFRATLQEFIKKKQLLYGPFAIFQNKPSQYIGAYINEVIAQKIKIKDLSKRFGDYFPQSYFNMNGSYRQLF